MRTSYEPKPDVLQTWALQSVPVYINQGGLDRNSVRPLQRDGSDFANRRPVVAFRRNLLTNDHHRSSSLPRRQSQIIDTYSGRPASKHLSHEFLDDVEGEWLVGTDSDYMQMTAPVDYTQTQMGTHSYYQNGQELRGTNCMQGTDSQYMDMGPQYMDMGPQHTGSEAAAAPRRSRPVKEQRSLSGDASTQFDRPSFIEACDMSGKRFILIPETQFQASTVTPLHSGFRDSSSAAQEFRDSSSGAQELRDSSSGAQEFRDSSSAAQESRESSSAQKKDSPKKKKGGFFSWFGKKSPDEKKSKDEEKPQEGRQISIPQTRTYRRQNQTSAGSTSASSQGSNSPRCSPQETQPMLLSESGNFDDPTFTEDPYHMYMEVIPDECTGRKPSPPPPRFESGHPQLRSRRSNSPPQGDPRRNSYMHHASQLSNSPQQTHMQVGLRRSNSPPQQTHMRLGFQRSNSPQDERPPHPAPRRDETFDTVYSEVDEGYNARRSPPQADPRRNSYVRRASQLSNSSRQAHMHLGLQRSNSPQLDNAQSSLRKSTSYGSRLATLDVRPHQTLPGLPAETPNRVGSETAFITQKLTSSRTVATQTDSSEETGVATPSEETGVATQTESLEPEREAALTADDLAKDLQLALEMVQNRAGTTDMAALRAAIATLVKK
ncbi:MAG: uncharacterized protein KVP18_002993 [Porospora cf. gigantea A]|uniref:uncharacterized protein n=1 Tax=Porospora cf. gigantea A TaxID=2853593 RepID=UPI003559DFC1|nr:MAG: hypothetical protein KVP18_002993 [Porospora cf. gigantea A]